MTQSAAPALKVRDIAYVRFSAPDLPKMQQFLTDFGLVVNSGPGGALYARGTDASPYCHVTEPGPSALVAVGFEAGSADDLRAAAQLEGASAIEKIEAPGGGERVMLRDPDGNAIEIVHGRALLPPLSVRSASPLNRGSDRQRFGKLQRVSPGPSSVKRLGHAVLRVSDFRRSADWYKSRLGFVASDAVYIGEPGNVITEFMRCDLGDEYTDHHTFLCVGVGEPGFDHAAFEVEDFDTLMAGHDHLTRSGYDHHAGIGRHVLGSQIFDYWRDPWGHVVEHFTDGDLLDASHPTGIHDPATALGTQWGRFG